MSDKPSHSQSLYLPAGGLKELNAALARRLPTPVVEESPVPSKTKSIRQKLKRSQNETMQAPSRVRSMRLDRKVVTEQHQELHDEASQLNDLIAQIASGQSRGLNGIKEAIASNPGLLKLATPDGNTLLHAVVSVGHLDWTLDLLRQGASPAA
ncbi:MAG: hypothetical protein Q8P67_25895, partial [archaeon]|nr:hypothetical protein [archaeon]